MAVPILSYPGFPVDSRSDAMLTSCPQTSKLHFRKPSTPQITAPLWIPTRNWSSLPCGRLIYLKSRKMENQTEGQS